MNTRARIFGALFAAVVGGCAGTKSTVVPINPVSSGAPVDANAYELMLDGRPAGSVLLESGRAVQAQNSELVRVGLKVDNTTDRTFQMPADQIYLTTPNPAPLKLVQIDGQPATTLVVPPGQSRHVELAFQSTEPMPRHQLDQMQVHWTLLIDGATAPIVRTTAFEAVRTQAALDRNEYARRYDIPSSRAALNLSDSPINLEQRAVGSPTSTYWPGDNRNLHTRTPAMVQEPGSP